MSWMVCFYLLVGFSASQIVEPANENEVTTINGSSLEDEIPEEIVTDLPINTSEAPIDIRTEISPTWLPENPEPTTSETEKTTILFSNFYSLPPPKEQVRNQQYEKERMKYSEEHPCKRNCSEGISMVCLYKFVLERYHSMSKACYDCPYNLSHCYLPDCIPVDGVKRTLTVVNRMLPGPSIDVCEGDEIIVDVVNKIPDSGTSFHWHGQHQKENPYMDGVPFVTQCPISPLSTFRYQFKANTAGTHFWHSHLGNQRADGVFGPLIVRRAQELHGSLYDFDLPEHTIVVEDWTHQTSDAVFTFHHHSNGTNKPTNIHVNGRGRFEQFGTELNEFITTPLSSFTVEQDKKYRFRLINAGVLNCPVEISIDNHKILAISTDGADIEPVEVDSLVSYAGERWDFVLNANATIGNYWIRFRGLMDCDERYTSAHSASILHYSEATLEPPSDELSYEKSKRTGIVLNPLNSDCSEMLCMNNINSSTPAAVGVLDGRPDKQFVFAYDFYKIDNPHFHKPAEYAISQVRNGHAVFTPQLNHISLRLQPFPLLSQYSDLKPGMLCDDTKRPDCDKTYCECTNVVRVKTGHLVELTLIDIGETYDANHPFHLHGYQFGVVAVGKLGNQTSVEEVSMLDKMGKIEKNLVNPVMKDTVNVPDGGYTIVRFRADNPGYWIFHCHLEWHAELGMALIIKVGEHSEFPPIPKGFPRCGDYTPPIFNDTDKTFDETLTQTNEIIPPILQTAQSVIKINELEADSSDYMTYNSSKVLDDQRTVFTVKQWWLHKSSGSQKLQTSTIVFIFVLILTIF